jgi:short-subunit dehydrogenase
MSKTALITGASSGIGYELAKCFARDGTNLVLVARDETRLGLIASELRSLHVSVKIIAADLARPVAPSDILDATRAANIDVDYLVNNAGFGLGGYFAESDLRTELDMMQVNMVALTHLTRLYLPGMRQRGSGGVLNVASTAAFQPGPLMALYYATKAFVLSFTEAIAEELLGTGVTATALCPGPTATAFQRRAKIERIRLVKSKIGVMSAQAVAEIGYRGFKEGKVVVIPGLLNKIGAQSVRISPRVMVRKVTRKLQES